ncbi:MAG: hypothetical protein K2M81_02705 [Lachnospiraceae bacterium]|nr:hypothetical protein [Lachnospiraceae bacterium]
MNDCCMHGCRNCMYSAFVHPAVWF